MSLNRAIQRQLERKNSVLPKSMGTNRQSVERFYCHEYICSHTHLYKKAKEQVTMRDVFLVAINSTKKLRITYIWGSVVG